MSSFAVEANFIPRRAPHEIIDKISGNRLCARINRWLACHGRRTGVHMLAKLDPHHNVYAANMTWSVEVVPVMKFNLSWVYPTNASHQAFLCAIDTIFSVLDKRFGLVPVLVTRKGNIDLHHPIGGQHVMMDASIFPTSTDWYRQMERFHRDLLTDYANKPFIRWLVAHWCGGGSHVVADKHRLEERAKNGGAPLTRHDIFCRGIYGASAIEPRFMASAKNSYLTFEFRIVGMVENARQMCAVVRLLKAWMDQHVERVNENKRPVRFTLTPARWDEMVTPEGARRHCRAWVESLNLNWSDYEVDFFERNCLMRINHGVME